MPSADTPAASPERLDPALLAALPGLLDAVGPKPWAARSDYLGSLMDVRAEGSPIAEGVDPDCARLIALAPTLARAVLAAEARAEAAEAERDRLRAEMDKAGELRWLVEVWAEARRAYGAWPCDSNDARFHGWQSAEHALLAALATPAREGGEDGHTKPAAGTIGEQE